MKSEFKDLLISYILFENLKDLERMSYAGADSIFTKILAYFCVMSLSRSLVPCN